MFGIIPIPAASRRTLMGLGAFLALQYQVQADGFTKSGVEQDVAMAQDKVEKFIASGEAAMAQDPPDLNGAKVSYQQAQSLLKTGIPKFIGERREDWFWWRIIKGDKKHQTAGALFGLAEELQAKMERRNQVVYGQRFQATKQKVTSALDRAVEARESGDWSTYIDQLTLANSVIESVKENNQDRPEAQEMWNAYFPGDLQGELRANMKFALRSQTESIFQDFNEDIIAARERFVEAKQAADAAVTSGADNAEELLDEASNQALLVYRLYQDAQSARDAARASEDSENRGNTDQAWANTMRASGETTAEFDFETLRSMAARARSRRAFQSFSDRIDDARSAYADLKTQARSAETEEAREQALYEASQQALLVFRLYQDAQDAYQDARAQEDEATRGSTDRAWSRTMQASGLTTSEFTYESLVFDAARAKSVAVRAKIQDLKEEAAAQRDDGQVLQAEKTLGLAVALSETIENVTGDLAAAQALIRNPLRLDESSSYLRRQLEQMRVGISTRTRSELLRRRTTTLGSQDVVNEDTQVLEEIDEGNGANSDDASDSAPVDDLEEEDDFFSNFERRN